MNHFYRKAFIAFATISYSFLSAQNERLKNISQEYLLNNDKQVNFIRLKENYPVYENNTEAFLNSMISDNGEIKAKKIKETSDNFGYTHTKYQLYYNDTKINNSIVNVHARHGKVVSVNGDLEAIQKPVNSVVLNESSALKNALKKVNAKRYKWENKTEEQHMRSALNDPSFSYAPKGEVIIYHPNNNQDKKTYYAYKFTIYAEEPLYKANVIVDAQSGTILAEENLICTADVPSTASTLYSGTQTMTIDNYAAGAHRLRETGRGNGIETYDLNNGSSYGAATDFTNTSTTWSVSGVDQAATDAHWGAEKTYDYYLSQHNRNSIDNAGFKLLSYVHYNTNYANAFWDGARMTYGDGNGTSFTILTALDVCGHEITHGLTEMTANLNYSYESGALNESFSDIFGTSIENYARSSNWDWKIGADMTPSGNGIRNMANPKLFSDPHTYGGQYWYTGALDNGGVHTNSGVGNFWFYLLSTGGTGTNDVSNSYTVNALGMSSAAQIAFRALTVYFTPTTDYMTARNLSIQAAKDLYGNCSNEVVQTTNAWYAVGVGPAYSNVIGPDFTASNTSYCTSPATISFNNITANGITYTWDFGDGSVSTSTNPAHTYTSSGNFTVKLKATGCLSSVDSISKTAYININTPPNPTTTGASVCNSGSMLLNASGTGQLYWYASPSATGTPINIGPTYSTPTLTNSITYYVVNTSSNTPVYGAPTNSAIGAGSIYTLSTAYDVFSVLQPCTLKTVVMYASTAGNRTVQLRSSTNAVITSTVVTLAAGANTVNLNFVLTPGSNYRLGTGSGTINLFRNSAGASYPYNIGGMVNITGSSATGNPGYFYFFYNWQVQKANCTSSPIPVTATVTPAPNVTVNSPTICNGNAVSLNASGATTYSWSSGQTGASISVNPGSNTSYTVYGDNGSCSGMSVSNVVVNPTPVVSATASQTSACLTDGLITLSGNPTGGTFSGTGVSGTNFDPSVGAGTYPVTYSYTDANSCTGSAVVNMLVSICAGIENISGNSNGFNIYPNPVSEQLHIISPSEKRAIKIRVYDVNGRIVIEKESGSSIEHIDVAKLSAGTYFVEILEEGVRVYDTKIIKQ
jgi:Zn-dependent metalloprotease